MKSTHLPRSLLILLFLLISVIFLTGSLHAFMDVRAVVAITTTPSAAATAPVTATPGLEPTGTTAPTVPSGDTSGILAMAGVVLVIILFGALVGVQKPRPHPKRS
jgi:hypothetical protein